MGSDVRLAHLMQRINLLHFLNHTPEKPTDNFARHADEQTQIEGISTCRVLSLQQERRIAEAFVSLATCSDDPKRVMAACVEEGKDSRSITVKLAVNNGVLEGVQEQL